jgi:acyl-CoA thioester hydrolase
MGAITTAVRARYAETDAMGIVYYANFFVWFEVARGDWLRPHGCTYRDLEASGTLLPVIHAECVYRRPVRYDDDVEILVDARLVSAVRLEFSYEVTLKGQPGTVATGRTLHAAVGRDGRPCRLPDRIVKVVS